MVQIFPENFEFNTNDPLLVAEATRIVRETVFEPAVEKMLKDFDQHSVTKEIKEGIDAPNYSRTLPQDSRSEGQKRRNDEDRSRKNLWNFIGFDGSDDPTDVLKQKIEEDTTIKYIPGSSKKKLSFQFEVKLTDSNELQDATPLPWANGISCADRIEKGIPNFGQFLNALNKKNSRSGGGIQVKSTLRSEQFKPTKYLSEIFDKFLERFRK